MSISGTTTPRSHPVTRLFTWLSTLREPNQAKTTDMTPPFARYFLQRWRIGGVCILFDGDLETHFCSVSLFIFRRLNYIICWITDMLSFARIIPDQAPSNQSGNLQDAGSQRPPSLETFYYWWGCRRHLCTTKNPYGRFSMIASWRKYRAKSFLHTRNVA